MEVCLLKSKIHRATITGGNVQYEGSMTIASDLMEKCGLIPYDSTCNLGSAAWVYPARTTSMPAFSDARKPSRNSKELIRPNLVEEFRGNRGRSMNSRK